MQVGETADSARQLCRVEFLDIFGNFQLGCLDGKIKFLRILITNFT